MKRNLFYLTGFMASGKSTVGPILANTLGWRFFDLDIEIEKHAGMKITEIFKLKGESYFRKVETEILTKISRYEKSIISLGGGTITTERNREIIKATGMMIYLKSSPEIAYKRLKFKRNRPALLFESEELPPETEFINRISVLLEARKEYYEEADFVIETDSLSVGKTVDRLVRFIEKNKTR